MPPSFEHVVRVCAKGDAGDDRAAVFQHEACVVVALADGAGGTSNGARAAEAVVESASTLPPDADLASALEDLDADASRLGDGQTTAIVLVIDNHGVRGASVGDSEAWLVDFDQRIKKLTRDQIRKPLLGSGASLTSVADSWPGDVTLLVASDGLFRFAAVADIARIVVGDDLGRAADELIALVRTSNGALQDDVSIVLVRRH
jgi:serine/threonine protein phosphatase PrpC